MTKRRITLVSIISVLIIVGVVAYLLRDRLEAWFFRPTASSIEEGVSESKNIEVAAQDFTVPWEVAFLPNDELLVSERNGTLKRIGRSNTKVLQIDGVQQTSESGLLGLALHPDFSRNRWVYVYYTTANPDGGLMNKVERYRLQNDALQDKTEIITGIPAAPNHDGGRIAFGPDEQLYVTTGDAGVEASAQEKNSLAGKILRLQADGKPAKDNPFNNAVYSYGHRNPQGLTWDDDGQLWATEHGPSGSQTGYDELNRIKKGGNYGWPLIRGDETRPGMESPVLQSGSGETWAPAGLSYHDGSLFFAGLRGQTLYQARPDGDTATLKAHFREEYGRLRAVGVNGEHLYLTTSNTDGRGTPMPNDDKLLRIKLNIFE